MSSVSSSSAADSSLSDDVADDALFWVEGVTCGVGLEVVQEVKDVLAGLLGPPTIGVADVLAHGFAAWTTGVNSEWNDTLVGNDVLHVSDGLEQVHSLAGSGSLISVFEVSSQVIDSALGR